ncbi:MAG: 4Fe-4S dicluster domain-containing protein [Candidatus Thermoplasmatota archaeon]
MMVEKVRTISKKDLDAFVDDLIQSDKFEVVGVKSKGKSYVFDDLENSEELELEYDTTILPPKKYFLPPYENMMNYDLKKPFNVEESNGGKPRVIIGMHPYDIIAIEQMDKVYQDVKEDDFYTRRRKNTIIIGVDIEKPFSRCFAGSMGTHTTDSGFDLMLTKIGRKYGVTVGSKKGRKLLHNFAKTKKAKESDVKKIAKKRDKVKDKFECEVEVDKEDWPSVLAARYEDELWGKKSEKCLECSSCTMVCPTCYCYDVEDKVSLDLKDGSRVRTWDGCLLKDFTKVAGDEIFREDVEERYRHRFFRKGCYLPMRYGFVACVGCGRCARACLPDIADPCELLNNFSDVDPTGDASKYFIDRSAKMEDEGVIHVPHSATIKSMQKLTENETLFEIEMDDGEPLGHDPGQFVEVSVLGVGEAPISVSSPPDDSPIFELVIRRVGNVTGALFSKKPGDKVGIRGPFGNGFPLEEMEKKHLLFACGGIGMIPARSLIKHVLQEDYRKKFKDITILYGCKQPCEVLFMDEVKQWGEVPDVRCELTVDKCPEGVCWEEGEGLITDLFPKIKLDKYDSKNTVAIVVGPPVMYKFVIQCLKTLEIPEENIWVSLERRMKCGVGKCGHCQINGVYVCKEGPVFNYKDVKDLPEAFR